MGKILFKYQGDFGFHLGLNQAACGNLFTVTQRHVGEQLAEIRLIDPQLALYRRRRQPDFAAHRPLSLLDPLLVVEPLYGVGGIDILRTHQVTHRRAGSATLGGQSEHFGRFMVFRLQ